MPPSCYVPTDITTHKFASNSLVVFPTSFESRHDQQDCRFPYPSLVQVVRCTNMLFCGRFIDVAESLPELIARRMKDLSVTSLNALHRLLPPGDDRITYETLRLLNNGQQRGTRDERVFRDLALMLDVDTNTVRAAIGVEPDFGPFDLPPRAQGLDPQERSTVVGVMDAILRAKRGASGWPDGAKPANTGPSQGDDTQAEAADASAVSQISPKPHVPHAAVRRANPTPPGDDADA